MGEGQQVDPAQAQALAAEPAAQYYARIYREYINAKKALGEQTDHITEQAFATRIQGMERDASQKYGRPVRYQVHARNKEVVLLAVPLPGLSPAVLSLRGMLRASHSGGPPGRIVAVSW